MASFASRFRFALTSLLVAAAAAVVAAPTFARAVSLNADQTERFLAQMNVMSEVALKARPGLTAPAVAKILAFRKEGKVFGSIDEFKTVTGLGAEEMERLLASYTRSVALDEVPSVRPGPAPGEPAAGPNRRAGLGATKGGAPAASAPSTPGAPAEELELEVKANYYSILPGYDLAEVDSEKKQLFLDRINREFCTCGCQNETLAYCLVNDPGCPVVKARVRKIYTDVVGQPPKAPAAPKQ